MDDDIAGADQGTAKKAKTADERKTIQFYSHIKEYKEFSNFFPAPLTLKMQYTKLVPKTSFGVVEFTEMKFADSETAFQAGKTEWLDQIKRVASTKVTFSCKTLGFSFPRKSISFSVFCGMVDSICGQEGRTQGVDAVRLGEALQCQAVVH